MTDERNLEDIQMHLLRLLRGRKKKCNSARCMKCWLKKEQKKNCEISL